MKQVNKELFVGYFFIGLLLIFGVIIIILMGDVFNIFSNDYYTFYRSGDGIEKGTSVTLNGIEAGEVLELLIISKNKVKVRFSVKKKFERNIREDSKAKIIRKLMIGKKQISISSGDMSKPKIKPGGIISSEESSELIDMISGISLQNFAETFQVELDPDLSGRKIYEEAIGSLVLLRDFQVSIEKMVGELNTLSSSMESIQYPFYKMDKTMNSLAESLGSLDEFAVSMKSLNEEIKKMNSVLRQTAYSINGMDKTLNGVEDAFKPIGSAAKDLDPILYDMGLLLKALQENALFKRDFDKVKERYKSEEK